MAELLGEHVGDPCPSLRGSERAERRRLSTALRRRGRRAVAARSVRILLSLPRGAYYAVRYRESGRHHLHKLKTFYDDGRVVQICQQPRRWVLWRTLGRAQVDILRARMNDVPPAEHVDRAREPDVHEAALRMAETHVMPDVLEVAFASMTAPSSAPRRLAGWGTIYVEALAHIGRHEEALTQLTKVDDHGLLELSWLERAPPPFAPPRSVQRSSDYAALTAS